MMRWYQIRFESQDNILYHSNSNAYFKTGSLNEQTKEYCVLWGTFDSGFLQLMYNLDKS